MRTGYNNKHNKTKSIGTIVLIAILLILILLFAMKVFNFNFQSNTPSDSNKYTGGEFDVPPTDEAQNMNPNNMMPNEIPQIISPKK